MGNLIFGLTVAVLGMVVVFVGLMLLIGAITVSSRIIGKGQKPAEKKDSAPAPVVVEDSIPEPVEADDTQLIAVITAALMAYQENGKQLVVRSVRRVGTRSAWAEAGRREQLN